MPKGKSLHAAQSVQEQSIPSVEDVVLESERANREDIIKLNGRVERLESDVKTFVPISIHQIQYQQTQDALTDLKTNINKKFETMDTQLKEITDSIVRIRDSIIGSRWIEKALWWVLGITATVLAYSIYGILQTHVFK